jgi:hypothetical protein
MAEPVSRRGFMGFFAGAAVAGKKITTEAAKALADVNLHSKYTSTAGSMIYGKKAGAIDTATSVFRNDPISLVASLKKEISKVWSPSEYTLRENALDVAMKRRSMEIETLRSVSYSHKISMVDEIYRQNDRLRDENRFNRYINNILSGRNQYEDD